MKNVTNTTKRIKEDSLYGWLTAFTGIEHQEKVGQSELVNSCQLPSKNNTFYRDRERLTTEQEYERLGIKVIGKSSSDDLFLDVELPTGWQKKATSHSMWNELINDKGEVVATFFYKAAFYDRDAFINFKYAE